MSEEQPLESAPSERRPSRLFALAKPAAIIAVIVAVECVAVAVLLPSPKETEEVGKELAAAHAGKEPPATEESEAHEAPHAPRKELLEVDLGSHHVAIFQPGSNSTLRIDVHIYATVLADALHEFETLYPLHQHRVSEQVQSAFRAAQITDLTDAGLGLIKRQILEKTNRTLGKPLVEDVVFSKFSFLEH
jgi:flagellar FliL protein